MINILQVCAKIVTIDVQICCIDLSAMAMTTDPKWEQLI
jgi:hypothetical protein